MSHNNKVTHPQAMLSSTRYMINDFDYIHVLNLEWIILLAPIVYYVFYVGMFL